ncbi:PAS domain-containing protein [Singulisphaera rosea]
MKSDRLETGSRVDNRDATGAIRLQAGTKAGGLLENPLFHTLLDAFAAIAWTTQGTGEFDVDQPAWRRYTGQTQEQLLGWGWIDAIHPEDRPNTTRIWSQALATRTHYQVEHRVCRHDGEYRHMAAQAVPILVDDTSIREWVGVHIDITDRKRAEASLRQSEERFRKAFEASVVGMALVTQAGEWILVNPALGAIVGLSEGEFSATTFHAIVHPADLEANRALSRDLLAGEISHYQSEMRYLHKLGHMVWCLMSVSLVGNSVGQPGYFVAQILDITPRKRTEEALSERARLAEFGSDIVLRLARRAPLEEMLHECADSLAGHFGEAFVGIWLLEHESEVLDLRARAGIPPKFEKSYERVSSDRSNIGRIARERRPHLTNAVIGDPRMTDQDWGEWEGMVAFAGFPLLVDDRLFGVIATFSRRPLSHDAFRMLDALANAIAMAIDRQDAEVQLVHQATHDGLTGLPNRGLLLLSIERSCEALRRTDPSAHFALLLLDLDHFKEINDTFGHHFGDEVLRLLTSRLLGLVRDSDLVARLGGDEISILLLDTDESEALRVADRILAELRLPITIENQPFSVGVSIGVALFPDHGRDAMTLLRRADTAMYAAKRSRSGRLVYADFGPDRNRLGLKNV